MQTEPSKSMITKERETKTIYVNERHLKPVLKEKILKGMIDPYNIGIHSLSSEIYNKVKRYEKQGFKTVFVFDNKNVLLNYAK